MKIHGLELPPEVIEAIALHGERDYPSEACGVGVGPAAGASVLRAEPLKNVQDRYHARDPLRFPRSSRDAFRIDELERMRLLERLEGEGLVEQVLYHSHPDAGAYFSPEDRAMAVVDGIELMPGVVHVVVSVRAGRRQAMAAFRWDPGRRTFLEARIPLAGDQGPALALRAMEGREAARPIVPHGGRLSPRRVPSAELEALRARAAVELPLAPEGVSAVLRLGLGLLSPLPGFVGAAALPGGTLADGTPWRRPVELALSPHPSLRPGAWVTLLAQGLPIAVLALEAVRPAGAEVWVAGELWVHQEALDRPEAAERRADLLRRGAGRVLAVVGEAPLAPGFDAVLSVDLPTGDPWIDAVMAQNMGATHILTSARAAEEIRHSLTIEPLLALG